MRSKPPIRRRLNGLQRATRVPLATRRPYCQDCLDAVLLDTTCPDHPAGQVALRLAEIAGKGY